LGWLGWIASGGGNASFVPTALLAVGLIGMTIGGAGASLLSSRFGWSPWGGLAVSFNPGIIYGITADTAEPLSVGLLVIGLLAWFNERRIVATVLFAGLCLVKEPFLAVPAGLIVWEILAGGGLTRPVTRRVALLATAALPLIVWWVYLYGVFREWPTNQPWLITPPLVGWIDTMLQAADNSQAGDFQIGHATLPLMIAIGTAFVVAIVRARHIRTPFDPIFLFFMIGTSILSWYQLFFPKELMRILAIPVLLLPAVFAARGARETYVDKLTTAARRDEFATPRSTDTG
jgi:hypothetical protein